MSDRLKALSAAMTSMAVEYDYELNPQKVKLWHSELAAYPIDAVLAAIRSVLRKSRFFPRLSEIIEAIDGSESDNALVAWEAVYRIVRAGHCDRAYSIEFSDRAIQDAVRMIGGWRRLRMMRDDEVPFRQKDFVAAYGAAIKSIHPICIEAGHGVKHDLLGMAAAIGKPVDSPKPEKRQALPTSPPALKRRTAQKNEQIRAMIRRQIADGHNIASWKQRHPELVAEVMGEAH